MTSPETHSCGLVDYFRKSELSSLVIFSVCAKSIQLTAIKLPEIYSSFFSVIISSIFVLRSIFCGQEKEWCVKGVKEGPEAVARIRKILEAVATTLIGKDCTGGGAGG